MPAKILVKNDAHQGASVELGFMSRTLAQISLPHSELKSNYFERTSGLMTLSVVANPRKGLPYGSYPRLLLAWLCTEAVRTKSPNIHLGSNQAEFMRKLALNRDGRTIAALKEQTNRLVSSLFTVEFSDRELKGFRNLLLANSGFELWKPQTGEWETHLQLTTDFFNDIVQNPVPFDFNVLNALRKSPMAMDVYTWLVYRTYSIYVTGNRPVKISWSDLQAQFGANYGSLPDDSVDFKLMPIDIAKVEQQGLYDFKRKFLQALKKISQHYPELEQQLSADSHFLTVGGAKLIK